MEKPDEKIAFGGSCHWCTEAIFLLINLLQFFNCAFLIASSQMDPLLLIHLSNTPNGAVNY